MDLSSSTLFGDVPSDWVVTTIGNIASLQQGLQIDKKSRLGFPKEGYIPLLKITDLPSRRFSEYVTDIKEQHIANEDDIIYTRTGQVGLVYTDIKGCVHNNCFKVNVDYSKFDKKYIYYYLKSDKVYEYANQVASGSVQKDLKHSAFKACPIGYPALSEQKSIADTLSCLDDKIEFNNRINKTLEEMAQAIFKSWFVDFEPFQDGEFEDSGLGRIPKGWRRGTVSDLGNVIGGSTPSKSRSEYYTDQGIAWITPKDLSINKDKFISKGEIDITELGLKNSSAKIMPKGTVLFSSRAPIGYIAIAKNDITTNQGFKSVVSKNHIGNAYVYYFLKNNTEIIENRATGSTFKEVSGAIMKQIPAVIPSDKVLSEFQSMCDLYFNKQLLLEEENQNLIAIRNSLLPKLMSGEIRVPLEEVQ